MKKMLLVFMLIATLLALFVACTTSYEASQDDTTYYYKNLYSYNGTGWFKVTNNYASGNISSGVFEDDATDINGLVVGNGSNIGFLSYGTGDIVWTESSQQLDNKTLNNSIAKGTWTSSGAWTIPAHYAGTIYSTSTTSLKGSTDTNYVRLSGGLTQAKSANIVLQGYSYGSNIYISTPDTSDVEQNRIRVLGHATDGEVRIYSTLYAEGVVSADSFVDRTPFYEGDAVKELSEIKGINGQIDHNTLPDFTLVVRDQPIIDANGNITGYETVKERDLGATISMLTVAIKQLNERITALENK